MPDLSFTLGELVGYVSMLLALGGAWADLRSRSVSNAGKIDELNNDLEKTMKEVHDRIDKTEMKIMETDAKLHMASDKFNDYRERAAQTFVTADRLGEMKNELINEFRQLRDRLDRMAERKPPSEGH